jgi:hypothetical protein
MLNPKEFKELGMYEGEDQHGYWWLHYNGQLRYYKTCHGVEPNEFFKYAPCVKWWYVGCQFEWYKMRKEYYIHREGPVGNMIA